MFRGPRRLLGKLALPTGIALTGALVFGGVGAAANDPSKDVRVVNTPVEPVPVAVQGSVAVQGTPQVHVVNGNDAPVPVKVVGSSDRIPFVAQVRIFVDDGRRFANATIDVPDGYRMTIEHVSFLGGFGLADDNAVAADFAAMLDSDPFPDAYSSHASTPILFERDALGRQVADHSVLAFADPGTTIFVEVELKQAEGTLGSGRSLNALQGQLSGYLERVS
jgi:hypothetical protein